MQKHALITGICGFAGRHMCDYLTTVPERPKIIGIDILDTPPSGCDCFYKADISSDKAIKDIINQTKPDFIIHLAGTFAKGRQAYNVNLLSIISLLESSFEHVPNAVVVTAGSAAEYGLVTPKQLPLNEQTTCKPITSYGSSKHLASQIALYYHRVHKMRTMVVRPFQLIGKGVNPRLAPGAFAQQLVQIINKDSKVIKVGNLESYRDFLDIRDAVEAIWALCRKPAGGEIFNLCSGKPTKMADLLQMMIEHCGQKPKIEVDPSLLRNSVDVSKVYGSYQKIKNLCGWQPKRSLIQSVQAMLG
ncbi:MAG: NAD-dependent epimerase/dehydratase family protein [Phycisphaerae bacterium]|nr:NAD-dependent epimerase/dehydratase family protein [Phycisphaerae bacterium]NIU11010.1 NAD-dependent epimerase/dehydratase family protein [Phycisphaerae bacterium]NIV00378.1 NAD-dependent epimerase/dehydratase family protein [Phycisphaerae bacterium]NIW95163.1 NAD-dependent epimerase/dehydratase family protein [Phycisphaerae bacterium]NIX01095.1 NAD-dependent epimerase/dehydratase family protein [Phycisphaerae bacterium]